MKSTSGPFRRRGHPAVRSRASCARMRPAKLPPPRRSPRSASCGGSSPPRLRPAAQDVRVRLPARASASGPAASKPSQLPVFCRSAHIAKTTHLIFIIPYISICCKTQLLNFLRIFLTIARAREYVSHTAPRSLRGTRETPQEASARPGAPQPDKERNR